MTAEIWTSRDVQFTPYPRTDDETIDRFFDALIDRYWETWRHGLYGTLSLSSSSRIITVGGWPRWVPRSIARRSVTAIAAASGIGGHAVFVVERIVLTP
jgi:hypothetical protein